MKRKNIVQKKIKKEKNKKKEKKRKKKKQKKKKTQKDKRKKYILAQALQAFSLKHIKCIFPKYSVYFCEK